MLVAGALGIWAVRMVLKRARRIAATAGRISAQALNERLSLDDTPEVFLESTLAFNHMLDRLQGSFKRPPAFSPDPPASHRGTRHRPSHGVEPQQQLRNTPHPTHL